MWFSWWRICLQCSRPGFDPWVGKIPWRRERLPTPVLWPGEFHGLYGPWGHKELDMTEQLWLSLHFLMPCRTAGGVSLLLPSSPGNRLSWDASCSYAELVMSLTKSTEPVSASKHQGPTGWRKRSRGRVDLTSWVLKGHYMVLRLCSEALVFLKETTITCFLRNCWLVEEIWKHLSHSF